MIDIIAKFLGFEIYICKFYYKAGIYESLWRG